MTWVHLYNTNGHDYCYGGKGTIYLAPNSTYLFCAGNNYGTFIYYYKGLRHSQSFGPGYELGFNTPYPNVTEVTLTKWSGNAGCPE